MKWSGNTISGAFAFFQGSPVCTGRMVNSLQAKAKTPIMISMDAEWGVGMRLLDSVIPLPKQMMLGWDTTALFTLTGAWWPTSAGEWAFSLVCRWWISTIIPITCNQRPQVSGEINIKCPIYGIQYMKACRIMSWHVPNVFGPW